MNAIRVSLLGGLVLILSVAIVALTSRTRPTDASSPFVTHPLTGMSSAEIGQYALAWTKANDQITINGTPTVSVARPMKGGDLTNFGDTASADSSQFVVVLQGDFLVPFGAAGPTLGATTGPIHEKYLLEVFTQGGDLASLGGDPTGAYVKPAVGDPTLPDLPQSALPPTQTSNDYLKDLPAPLVDHLPADSSRAGWTTPPTPIATSAP